MLVFAIKSGDVVVAQDVVGRSYELRKIPSMGGGVTDASKRQKNGHLPINSDQVV